MRGEKDSVEVRSPQQQILYCACHDDYTLFDHISAVTKDGFHVERAQRMAAFMLFSGLGIPFIQAERSFFARNTWTGTAIALPMPSTNSIGVAERILTIRCGIIRGLIAIRRKNKVFDDLSVAPAQVCGRLPSRRGTAVYYIGDYLYCINNTSRPLILYLNGRVWILADIRNADAAGLREADKKAAVEPYGVLLLFFPLPPSRMRRKSSQ